MGFFDSLFRENVRHYKSCKYWQQKDWGLPWEHKCELGKDTPDGGYTKACSSYKKQLSFFENEYRCKDCARWDRRIFSGGCIEGYPTPRGEDSEQCEKFIKR